MSSPDGAPRTTALPTTPRSRRPAPRSLPPTPASPTPNELVAAPELALLVALHQLLDLVSFTLAAVHPELASEPSLLHPWDPRAVLADQIVQHGARLANAMNRYRAATLAALHRPDTSDDLPF
jgi:hypothetical protein